MPKNELPRESFEKRLKKKRKEKKIEEVKIIDPEEERLEKIRKKLREERWEKKRPAEEKQARIEKLHGRCYEDLFPIFKKVQKLVFKNEGEIVTEQGRTDIYFLISLKWDMRYSFDENGPGGGACWAKSIGIKVVMDPQALDNNIKKAIAENENIEDEYIISTLSESELIKETNRNWIKKILLGDGLTKRIWKKKVTLDDPDWETQVEDYILEELKQKKAI